MIVGRTAELGLIDRLVTDAREGAGGLLWIWGESGIGKTALTDAALTRGAELGCAPLRGAGDELTTHFPLLPVAEALGVAPDGADTERLLALVRQRCAATPVVLAVEDLHWADESSLLWWNRVARDVAAGSLPLLLIGTARPWPRRETLTALTDLVTRRAGTVLRLGPLAQEHVAALAAQLTSTPPGPGLSATLSDAGGNPRYVRDLVETPGTPAAGTAKPGAALDFVPPGLRAALRVAALLGTAFGATEWAAAAGQDVTAIAALAQDGIDAGILDGGSTRLRFRHEIIRQTLAAEIPAGVHGAAHASIAKLLARAGAPACEVARQLVDGPADLAPWVTNWLAGLPDADLYAEPAAFAELLARAAAALPQEGEPWESLNRRRGKVLFWLGRDEEALTSAVAVTARAGDPEMLVLAVRAALRLGRPEHALQVAAEYPLSPERPSRLWYARLTAWLAQALYQVAGQGSGETQAKEAVDLAIQSGDPVTIGYARYALAECGYVAAEAARLREALSAVHGRDPDSAELRVLLSVSHLQAAVRGGMPAAAAEDALTAALTVGQQADPADADAIRAAAASVCYLHGRWDEALAHLSEIHGHATIGARRAITALIALRRGDRATADACLAAEDPPRGGHPDTSALALTWALALRAEADGDLQTAVAVMRRALAQPPTFRGYGELAYLVRLALLAGDAETAREAGDAADDDAASDDSPARRAAARCCAALLADDAPGLLAVASAYTSFGWLLVAAMAHEEAAARLAAAGDTAGARAALTDAVHCYAEAEATWDIRRADARLRVYGVRRGPRSAHKRASTGWASLTPAELQIASLVVGGVSNADIAAQLFLSPRTVHTHVSHILRKLGASSRIDLVREAARHEP
jgi:DNA-binding CsgD family transcriptional regulator